ncbi:MAG: hypothetical protein LBI69_00315 [Puniceicoccales bacterium]|jgi:hypothetical protein|nr:hypothetical protein [Puniceicoccales bacterium]
MSSKNQNHVPSLPIGATAIALQQGGNGADCIGINSINQPQSLQNVTEIWSVGKILFCVLTCIAAVLSIGTATFIILIHVFPSIIATWSTVAVSAILNVFFGCMLLFLAFLFMTILCKQKFIQTQPKLDV